MPKMWFLRLSKGLCLAAVVAVATGCPCEWVDGYPAPGENETVEVLYLADTALDRDGISNLYRVNLHDDPAEADLKPVRAIAGFEPGVIPYDRVEAIALSLDGSELYVIGNRPPDEPLLGIYSVGTGGWTEVGGISGMPMTSTANGRNTVQAAVAPNGTLYVLEQRQDRLYTVDTVTAQATVVGDVRHALNETQLDVAGGDIAFGEDGRLYTWTNRSNDNNTNGLYVLNLPPAQGIVWADLVGGSGNSAITGLAPLRQGNNRLAGSSSGLPGQVSILRANTGSTLASFPMSLSGEPFFASSGDMASGAFSFCAKGICYYEENSWNGAEVVICGITVDETLGKEVFEAATGSNFSKVIAKLIVAKLNVEGVAGFDAVDDAEAWLCSQTEPFSGGGLDYDASFADEAQEDEAAFLNEVLDDFIQDNKCR